VDSYLKLNCPGDVDKTTTSNDGTVTQIKINDDGTATTTITAPSGYTSTFTGNPTCKFEYNYAFSLWFNIDTAAPSPKFLSILNYGEQPNVKYQGTTNTLMITMQKNSETNDMTLNSDMTALINGMREDNYTDFQISQKLKEMGIELDEFNNLIVYKNSEVLLQRWNNLVINYTGGTLDIFLNGELVRSSIEIAPFMEYDNLIVGEKNGLNGGISSLIYYKHPLSILEIHGIYNTFKDKNPPVFPDDTKLIDVKKL
jgi:hypothetical protein